MMLINHLRKDLEKEEKYSFKVTKHYFNLLKYIFLDSLLQATKLMSIRTKDKGLYSNLKYPWF